MRQQTEFPKDLIWKTSLKDYSSILSIHTAQHTLPISAKGHHPVHAREQ